MGLNQTDKIPSVKDNRKAYEIVRNYYQNNKPFADSEFTELLQKWENNKDEIDEFCEDVLWNEEREKRFYEKFGFEHDKLYKLRCQNLINNLPAPENVSDLEIDAVMIEVICGCLEDGYHKDDGKYKMGAYAKAVVGENVYCLSEEKTEKIKKLPIAKFLSKI